MIRATTPIHKFIFEKINPETFKVLNIYYSQQGVELLKKEKTDCVFSSVETEDGEIYMASITLTQEETKLFKSRYPVKIQLRALTETGHAIATDEYEVKVKDVINDEVLE